MSPEYCRAARAWLKWSRQDLSRAAGVSAETLSDFETRRRKPTARTLGALKQALQMAGVSMLIDADGDPTGLVSISRDLQK